MRLITMTSDNYAPLTRLLVESVRVWHPDIEVRAYALDTNWTAQHAKLLEDVGVDVRVIHEVSTANRAGANGQAVHNLQKLDAMLDQDGPFLFLDSDMLVFKPLDRVFTRIESDGWFTVHETDPLGHYNQGEIAALSGLPDDARDEKSLNPGCLGAAPKRFGDVITLADEWGYKITANVLGDQGLLNLAFHRLRGCIPPCAGKVYNGGTAPDGCVRLEQAILHIAGPNWRKTGLTKLEYQQRVWDAWPRGVALVNLTDTDFWQSTLPHPWPWINQANQKQHRAFVRLMRDASRRDLLGHTDWLLVPDADFAYLLHADVLSELERFWANHADRFAKVKHEPTYHLPGTGRAASAMSHRLTRWKQTARALIR